MLEISSPDSKYLSHKISACDEQKRRQRIMFFNVVINYYRRKIELRLIVVHSPQDVEF